MKNRNSDHHCLFSAAEKFEIIKTSIIHTNQILERFLFSKGIKKKDLDAWIKAALKGLLELPSEDCECCCSPVSDLQQEPTASLQSTRQKLARNRQQEKKICEWCGVSILHENYESHQRIRCPQRFDKELPSDKNPDPLVQPLLQQKKLVQCPHCKVSVNPARLVNHIQKKCPERPSDQQKTDAPGKGRERLALLVAKKANQQMKGKGSWI